MSIRLLTRNRKLIVYAGISLFITAGISATHIPSEKSDWQNVQVIPKNVDEDQMERIMHRFSNQLGVTCSYCHPDTKPNIFPRRVDFVTDDKPEKKIARKMMIMTDKLDKKYFDYQNDYSFKSLENHPGITCNTCHRGLPKPSNIKLFSND